MTRLRRALSRIAVTWLLCQVATLTFAPAALWSGSAEALLECTCAHSSHGTCPMHHAPAPKSAQCVLGSADDGDVAVADVASWRPGPITRVDGARPSRLPPRHRRRPNRRRDRSAPHLPTLHRPASDAPVDLVLKAQVRLKPRGVVSSGRCDVRSVSCSGSRGLVWRVGRSCSGPAINRCCQRQRPCD